MGLMYTIRHASAEDAPIIKDLAERIWWPTYRPILSEEQIRYMLHHIYDLDTISRQLTEDSQTCLLLYSGEQPAGFASFSPRPENPEVYKLHKLYCLPENQGSGLGKMMLQAVEERTVSAGIPVLELNVNRYNPAKGFYEKMGYAVAYEEDIPIGPYWMNDFVMRKVLNGG